MNRQYCKTGVKKPKRKSDANANWIPHAPTGRRLATIAEKDLQDWRELLEKEFPMMSPEQISRADQSFHMLLLHDMITAGDAAAAQEIHALFRKEDKERLRCRPIKASLRDQHKRLQHLAATLKICYDHAAQGDPVASIELKKKLAEEAVKSGDTWMARHFLLSSLSLCRQLSDKWEEEGEDISKWSRIQAELHCMLAFLARESNETLENTLALAIDHLAICRRLSKDQHWQFKPRVIIIKLKKPIAIHGLRTDEDEIYDIVDGCSMPMYMIATLLEHELLISLANQIMHSHRSPTEQDLKIAHEFADHALKLALEVRQPTAMSSAYVRFGLVLRHSGAYDDALTYFNELRRNAIVTGDILTEGIAYHNIGLCLIGCHNSKNALESFANQLDLATENEVKDLEADAMYEIGHLFLQEGYMWEAEECYTISFEDFSSMHHTNAHSLAAWAMLGISAGHKTWGRFASVARHNRISDYYALLGWKTSRAAIRTSHRPSYKPIKISKLYPAFLKKMAGQGPSPSVAESESEYASDADEFSSDSFHEYESRAKYDENYKKPSFPRAISPAKSKADEGELPEEEEDLEDLRPSLKAAQDLRGSAAARMYADEYHGEGYMEEEDDFEGTEHDISQLEVDDEYVDPDPDELPGYTRYNAKRISSGAMIGAEMFRKVRPPSVVADASDSSGDTLLKDIQDGWKELKGKGKSKKKRMEWGGEAEVGGEDYGDEDGDSDDSDSDDDERLKALRMRGEWRGEGDSEWRGELDEWPGEGDGDDKTKTKVPETPENTTAENTTSSKRSSVATDGEGRKSLPAENDGKEKVRTSVTFEEGGDDKSKNDGQEVKSKEESSPAKKKAKKVAK